MDMETIKKKVLEDVDPEVKRQKKKEMRIQRLIITTFGNHHRSRFTVLRIYGNFDSKWRIDVSDFT